jgi:hypothetical protein
VEARHLQSKEAFLEFMRERGTEPDLRQEGRSFVFAVFPVISVGMPGNLGGVCSSLKTHFIEATATHEFHSRIGQLTFSPWLCDIGPPRTYDFKLSHRPSEDHVFASAVLDIQQWKSTNVKGRRSMAALALLGCIERIKADWISDEDRADLMGIVLCQM